MNRRALIAAMPAAVVAGALSGAAAEETPIAAMYREWQAFKDAYVEASKWSMSDEDDNAWYRGLIEIEDKLMLVPSQTPRDMAIKMLVGHHDGELTCLDYDGLVWAEARALVGGQAL